MKFLILLIYLLNSFFEGKNSKNKSDDENMQIIISNIYNHKLQDVNNSLTDLDFKNSLNLKEEHFAVRSELIAAKYHFEGDIKFDLNKPNATAYRNNYRRYWTGGKIPYSISTKFSSLERAIIARAIMEYHTNTCIRFVPRQLQDVDYVYFTKDNQSCSSVVGLTGGEQAIDLNSECISVGTVQHELMHLIGFYHEQCREDREKYIFINYTNIIKGFEHNFGKYSVKEIDFLAAPYDYNSIMHYPSMAFSNGQGATIVPLDPSAEIGNRRAFSVVDIYKINKLYNCSPESSQ